VKSHGESEDTLLWGWRKRTVLFSTVDVMANTCIYEMYRALLCRAVGTAVKAICKNCGRFFWGMTFKSPISISLI
jgi:hypothetical protein